MEIEQEQIIRTRFYEKDFLIKEVKIKDPHAAWTNEPKYKSVFFIYTREHWWKFSWWKQAKDFSWWGDSFNTDEEASDYIREFFKPKSIKYEFLNEEI